MALINELFDGRWNRALSRLFNMPGGAPSPQLSPEIEANVGLDNLRADFAYLLNERRYARSFDIAAAAANVGIYRLRNPANSGVLVYVEKVFLGTTAAAIQVSVQSVGQGNTDLANTATGLPTDDRVNATGQTSAAVPSWANTGVASFAGFRIFFVPANTTVVDDTGYILDPGSILTIIGGTNNQELLLGCLWREIPLPTSAY